VEELGTLIERAQAGDVEAYGEIVRRFQDMAYGYAYSFLGDFHLAQDAFVQAYRDLTALREPAAFPGLVPPDRVQAVQPHPEAAPGCVVT